MRPVIVVLILAALAAGARADTTLVGGASGGLALQSDQYTMGGHVTARALVLPFTDIHLRVLAGLGPDHVTLQPAAHLRLRADLGDFRLFALAGAAMMAHWPHGGLSRFCAQADLPCSGVTAGANFGGGAGWRRVDVDVVVGTGDLPQWSVTLAVRLAP